MYPGQVPIELELLDGVRWRGETIVGQRQHDFLAVLATADGPISADRLAEQIWQAELPANPVKAVQVLASRVRSQCGHNVLASTNGRYRLTLSRDEIDATHLADLVYDAQTLLETDAVKAGEVAAQVLAIADVADEVGDSPLGEVRRHGQQLRHRAGILQAQALSRTGQANKALAVLVDAAANMPTDETLLVDLLRAESQVTGPAAALERLDSYRSGLRDRLGTDPGPAVQAMHQQLLAADRPVRHGLHYDATTLLGRGNDVSHVQALLQGQRVVSILGPGGLGKTRLAHAVGRQSPLPVVYFVELVGLTDGDDLVSHVGVELGVRDSVTSRRVLTQTQRADIRSRIASQLDGSCCLLVLDNCEHIIDSVADLVAFLVASTRDLRILMTSRAPLAISAERVYALPELADTDAIELFRERAAAARPNAQLSDAAIGDVVATLDGLPLAIELAAAQIRVMSVDEIARRLDNRFALLRGHDRSAPDRHQTLLAVIEWSWNLLAEADRHALRRLSLFHDGFTLETAESITGPDALASIDSLTRQSLLTVTDNAAGVRYRMLETVREFGLMQLVDSDDEHDARRAYRQWAIDYARNYGALLLSAHQFDAIDAIHAEEANLSDVLRLGLTAADPNTVIEILGALSPYWTIRGEHIRALAIGEAVSALMDGWEPPPELEETTRVALASLFVPVWIMLSSHAKPIYDVLNQIGPSPDSNPLNVLIHLLPTTISGSYGEFEHWAATMADDPDPDLAATAAIWLGHARENRGDLVGAAAAAERVIRSAQPGWGPWIIAAGHNMGAWMTLQLGRYDEAAFHIDHALPVMRRLGADDDVAQLLTWRVLLALAEGDLGRANERFHILEDHVRTASLVRGRVVEQMRAELALAGGEALSAVEQFDAIADDANKIPQIRSEATGVEPWVVFTKALALSVRANFVDLTDSYGTELYDSLFQRVQTILAADPQTVDIPVAGIGLFALGSWALRRGLVPSESAIRLLVLARHFSYNQAQPSTAWETVSPHAEDVAPGAIARIEDEFGDAQGIDLMAEARTCLAALRQ